MPQHLDEIRAKNPQLATKLTENMYCVSGEDVEPLIAVNPNTQVRVKFNMMRVTIAVSMLNHLLGIVGEHTKLKAASLGMADDLEITGRHGTDYVRGVSLLVGHRQKKHQPTEKTMSVKADCGEVFYLELKGKMLVADEDVSRKFCLWAYQNEVYSIRTLSTGGGSHYAIYELRHQERILKWLEENGVPVNEEDTDNKGDNHNQRRKQMSDTSSIKTMIDAINEQCDENFRILAEPTNDEFLSLFNGDELITENWDYEVEDRLKQIVKENSVQIDWPKDHLQSMNTVEDIMSEQYIDEKTADKWQKIATLLKTAKQAVDEAAVSLLTELYGPEGKATTAINEMQDALAGQSYMFTPQSEWTGGDSMLPNNFKWRKPHIANIEPTASDHCNAG